MKALITGAAGQLGRTLLQTVPGDVEAVGLDRSDLDVTDRESVARWLERVQPAVLINAAAYTAVDQAESEPERAYAVNADAVGALAQACADKRIRLVHISTDFVFDGSGGRPYRPHDATGPLNVYGASKLKGEQLVAAQIDLDWRIVRTAWVYAAVGRNFMLTMLRLFRERSVVRVVADQIGTPTSAGTLARCLWRAAADKSGPAIIHFTDAGVASRYDFAVAIYEEAQGLGLLSSTVEIVPIPAALYPMPARRPAYSVLDNGDIVQRLGLTPVHWRTGLREVLRDVRA